MSLDRRLYTALTPLPAEERATQRGTLRGLMGRRPERPATYANEYMLGWIAGKMSADARECDGCHRRLYLLRSYCEDCLQVAWQQAS